MNNKQTSKQKSFDEFLKKTLSIYSYNDLHNKLKISKKMINLLIKKPANFKAIHLIKLFDITGLTFDDFKPYIN